MFLRATSGLALWFAFLAAAGFSRSAAAADASPEEVLKAKGFHKINQYFALGDEAELTKKFHDLEGLSKKAADAQRKAAAAGKLADDKQKRIVECIQKRRELNAQLGAARSVELHNKLVTMINELGDRVNLMEKSDQEEKDAKAARATASQATEQYVESLLKLRKHYDEISEKYEQLGTDAAVQKALEELNQDNEKPLKLGPTGAFALLDRNLKRLESKIISETITLKAGGGNLWYVTVTLNGKLAQEVSLDTGSSIVSLPYKVAQQAGMEPSPSDPTVQLTLADGNVVEAKQVFAQSIRLGKFTVEHCECAVLPANLPHAEATLGLSYLEHFTYKIDSAKGKLSMSQIEQAPEKPGRRPPGRPEPRVRRTPGE
jgi:clan AA aspartic protease (TIGR02281 family)